jgi:hypothetical protein
MKEAHVYSKSSCGRYALEPSVYDTEGQSVTARDNLVLSVELKCPWNDAGEIYPLDPGATTITFLPSPIPGGGGW